MHGDWLELFKYEKPPQWQKSICRAILLFLEDSNRAAVQKKKKRLISEGGTCSTNYTEWDYETPLGHTSFQRSALSFCLTSPTVRLQIRTEQPCNKPGMLIGVGIQQEAWDSPCPQGVCISHSAALLWPRYCFITWHVHSGYFYSPFCGLKKLRHKRG